MSSKDENSWDDCAERYDPWYETFEGAVDDTVDWKILSRYLPQGQGARILDAGGGTGRVGVRLAMMSHLVTVSDLSLGMLRVAQRKLVAERLRGNLNLVQCDNRHLPFPDNTFDFALCWDGGWQAAGELVRVLRPGGGLSLFMGNRCGEAIGRFRDDAAAALQMLETRQEQISAAATPQEARERCERLGLEVLAVYGVCGWPGILGLSPELFKQSEWDAELFNQTVEMTLKLAAEPSVNGLTRHIVVYATLPG